MRTRTRRFDARSIARVGLFCVVVSVFLFAVQLLSAATRTLSPLLQPVFRETVAGLAPTLGIGWLAAYASLNGSVVAAVALSLFSARLIGVTQLFLLVAGSRLGAAGIVLLIGGLEFLRKGEYSLPMAMRLGTLTFLVSHSVYVPATALGAVVIGQLEASGWNGDVVIGVRPGWLAFFEPLAAGTVQLVGAVPSALAALFLLVGGLHVLDRLFETTETDRLRAWAFVLLGRRWLSFVLGVGVTALTSSVAFSIGVIVPIYNRGDIEREGIVPYVMGASIGTLADTLIVALALDSAVGVVVVLLLLVVAAVVTLIGLVCYRPYYAAVEAAQERLLRDERSFVVFLVSLVVVPLALVTV